MPRFPKGSQEAKDYMASLRSRKGGIEGGGKFDFFDDLIIPVGKKAGEPFKKTVGINPFTAGFNLGKDVIAPALMKKFPPKRGRGIAPPAETGIAPANRDLTQENAFIQGTGGSKTAGYIRMMVAAKNTVDNKSGQALPAFDIDLIEEQIRNDKRYSPSDNLKLYAKKAKRRGFGGKKGRPQIHQTPEAAYAAKLESNRRKRAERRANAPPSRLPQNTMEAALEETAVEIEGGGMGCCYGECPSCCGTGMYKVSP
jgi:hypothetical protein